MGAGGSGLAVQRRGMTGAPHGSLVPGGVPDSVRALAEADFSGMAGRFAQAGFAVAQPARGILRINAPRLTEDRLSLLVSVGVHGDETAPIEMLALLLNALSPAPQALAVDLLVVVGNLDAIAQGKRFLDADLNRLFCSERGALAGAAEARRADAIMAAAQDFFAAAGKRKWHLDLHTAIRPSLYPTFAIVPEVNSEQDRAALIDWLGAAGIAAVILNRKLAGTFSAYTALQFGANGCTAELGRIGALGSNDLSQFAATQNALDALLRTGDITPAAPASPHVFSVAQEIVKRSEAFTMAFDDATQNFTAMAPGAMIAEDGDVAYRVGTATEYVVFPNPKVRPGQRAGLMVVRRD
jgi:succinylglutamate desuccinylase